MNRNKQLRLILLVFGVLAFTGVSGQGLYAKFNAGYGFESGAQSLLSDRTITANNDYEETINVSFGKGFSLNGGIGFNMSDNISLELNVGYLMSGTQMGTFSDTTRSRERITELGARVLKVNPTAIFSIPMESGIQPYVKLGIVTGFGKVIGTFTNTNNGNVDIDEWHYSGGMSLGINSGFGALYSLSDNMKLFGEMEFTSLTYAPTKGELVFSTTNGVDNIPALDVIDKEVIYMDQIDHNVNINVTNPDQDVKTKYPFGSVAINVGIRFNF
ncbi:MAG: outer membrane beta-barrel protein [Cyclobacteriaceae bacterium]|nr:outer membrane beta-barrel protein [Cyclobacteriaceae bacterium]